MNARDPSECCPRFDPGPWRDQRLTWHDKLFVKDHVTSFLHIPLNFGAVMRRNGAAIDAADAAPPTMIVLSDEKSLWGADVYLEVTREVPGATMATLSGTFLTKVFEGPYRNIRSWIEQMLQFVRARTARCRSSGSTTPPVPSVPRSTARTTLSCSHSLATSPTAQPKKGPHDTTVHKLHDLCRLGTGSDTARRWDSESHAAER